MSRVANEKIFALIDAKKSGRAGKIDQVKFSGGVVYCRLHDTIYASISDNIIKLGTFAGIWQSATTKQRINAIARKYDLPGVYQKNFVWHWSDNDEEYAGIRVFERK